MRSLQIIIFAFLLSPGRAWADSPFAWGWNSSGELGNGTLKTQYNSPTPSSLPSGNISFVGQSAAIVDFAAYAWGINNFGQTGNASLANSSIPVTIPNFTSGVTALASGGNAVGGGYTLIVQNGAVWSLGNNSSGQLGLDNADSNPHPIPSPIPSLSSNVVSVAAGVYHSFAIQNTSLFAWGYNKFGELGDSTTSDRYSPVPVTGMDSGVTAISAGYLFSAAIKNGSVHTWGSNQYAQLGIGTADPFSHTSPVAIPALTHATAVAAGWDFCLALQDGKVYGWGNDGYGQAGGGNAINTSPTLKSGLPSNIIQIAAGGGTSYALASDGRLYAWGYCQSGQLGIGNPSGFAFIPTPTQVPAPQGYRWTSVAANLDSGSVFATAATSVPEPTSAFTMGAAARLLLIRPRYRSKLKEGSRMKRRYIE